MVLLYLWSICITFEGIITFVVNFITFEGFITFIALNSVFKRFDCTHKFSAVLLCQKMYGGNNVFLKIHLVFTDFSRHEFLFYFLFSFISIDEVSIISCCFLLTGNSWSTGCTGCTRVGYIQRWAWHTIVGGSIPLEDLSVPAFFLKPVILKHFEAIQ